MAYILQHRRDTLKNWQSVNPILADAEIGYILDKDSNGIQKSSLYKIGDGVHAWNDLPLFGFGGNIYENFEGNDLSSSVASRQAILDKLNEKPNAELVQSISPENGEYFGELYNDPENPLTWEQMQPYMEQQIVSRWVLAKEFQQIWNDFSSLENGVIFETNKNVSAVQSDLQKFKDEYQPVIDELQETVATHNEAMGPLQENVSTLMTDMGEAKTIINTLNIDVAALKTQPKSNIMSDVAFSNFQQDVEIGQAQYEENTLYFIYKEEKNQ